MEVTQGARCEEFGLSEATLRAIQNKEVSPLGSTQMRHVDVRIIAATNRDLRQRVQNGSFREDLYYRLNVMTIEMPPLRQRMEDIPLLCTHFIKKYNNEQNKQVNSLSPKAARLLSEYNYPGNVRQLANIIEHAMILTQGREITADCLPAELWRNREKEEEATSVYAGKTLREIEKEAIREALQAHGQRRDLTARSLGISVRTLHNKINEYGL